MKKYLFLCIGLLLLVGCTSREKTKNNIMNEVKNGTYSVVYSKVSNLSNEIQMFPTRDNEENFIYYVTSIRDNCKSYNEDEINSFYKLLNFVYKFSQNKIDYTYSDYQNDLNLIKNCI